MKRTIIRTIPIVGAISLASCTPLRGGGGGGGNSGDDDDSTGEGVVGTWELRTYTYGNTTYEYPSEYEYEGCTYSSGALLDLLASGVLVYSWRTDYIGECEYTTPYVSTRSGTWEMLSGALYSIRVDESYDYNCSLETNELTCAQEGGEGVLGFRRQ